MYLNFKMVFIMQCHLSDRFCSWFDMSYIAFDKLQCRKYFGIPKFLVLRNRIFTYCCDRIVFVILKTLELIMYKNSDWQTTKHFPLDRFEHEQIFNRIKFNLRYKLVTFIGGHLKGKGNYWTAHVILRIPTLNIKMYASKKYLMNIKSFWINSLKNEWNAYM